METVNIKIKYLKDVLGIRSILKPDSLKSESVKLESPLELKFDTHNLNSEVLFLSSSASLNIEELQLLEKIILALKIPFNKTDIAYLNKFPDSKLDLVEFLNQKNYGYIFLQGEKISEIFSDNSWFGNIFEFQGIKYFTSFHPREMIENPDLKKEAWSFYKTIIPTLNLKSQTRSEKGQST